MNLIVKFYQTGLTLLRVWQCTGHEYQLYPKEFPDFLRCTKCPHLLERCRIYVKFAGGGRLRCERSSGHRGEHAVGTVRP